MSPPVLITLDAVGGIWRYGIDLAAGLIELGRPVCFAGLGPGPTPAQRAEAEALGPLDWGPHALDWMARGPQEVAGTGRWMTDIAARRRAAVVQVNLPSLAADIPGGLPVVAVSHSCLASWFEAVQGKTVPQGMGWIHDLTAAGLARADVVVAPSASHAAAMARLYGGLGRVDVVHNASSGPVPAIERSRSIVSAGRWWDEGKNGALLDEAARDCVWPVRMLGANRGPNGAWLDIRAADHLGPLNHATAAELIAGAGIFVSPSLYEPFGLAVLEAARAGAPLVLADIPTFRELWEGAAAFFTPHDAAALAAVLNHLARDDARRETLGRLARERAARYTAQVQAQAMVVLYENAISNLPSMAAE